MAWWPTVVLGVVLTLLVLAFPGRGSYICPDSPLTGCLAFRGSWWGGFTWPPSAVFIGWYTLLGLLVLSGLVVSVTSSARHRHGVVATWVPVVVMAVVAVVLVLVFPARGVGTCLDPAPGGGVGGCVERVFSWNGAISWPTSSSFLWAYLAVMLLVLSGLVAGVATNVRAARRARAR